MKTKTRQVTTTRTVTTYACSYCGITSESKVQIKSCEYRCKQRSCKHETFEFNFDVYIDADDENPEPPEVAIVKLCKKCKTAISEYDITDQKTMEKIFESKDQK